MILKNNGVYKVFFLIDSIKDVFKEKDPLHSQNMTTVRIV